MADDLENRMKKLEMNFDEYMAMFYKWLDENRSEMRRFREENERAHREHEAQMKMLAQNDAKIVETQGMMIRLLNKIDERLDDHEGRLNASGI
jgi:hypothetical protein